MKFKHKLVLIGLSFSLPIAVLLFLMVKGIDYDIAFAQYEIYGNSYQRPLEKILKAVSEHGFLVKQYRATKNVELKDKISALQKGVDAAFEELESVDKELSAPLQFTIEGLTKRKREHYRVETVKAEWESLKKDLETATPNDAQDRHMHLASDVRMMITHSGDISNLILDPDLDSYYTMDVTLLALPQTQDRLSVIRNYGWDLLKKGRITQEDRIQVAVYAAQLKEADMDRVLASMQTALTEDPNFYGVSSSLQSNIAEPMKNYSAKTKDLLDLMGRIVSEPTLTVKPEEFAAVSTAARAASFDFWDKAVTEMDSLLQIRIKSFQADKQRYLLWTLLALLVSVVMTGAIMMSLRQVMHRIVKSSGSLNDSAMIWASLAIEQAGKHPELKDMATAIQDVAKNADELQEISKKF